DDIRDATVTGFQTFALPISVSPNDAYRSCHARNCGITLRQLIQPYVQNSTRTTRARRPGIVRGSLLIHGCPAMSGAGSPSRSARSEERRVGDGLTGMGSRTT